MSGGEALRHQNWTGCHLDGLVVGNVSFQDVNVGAACELVGDCLVGCGFVSDEADDDVVGVAGELAEKLELYPCDQ